jgi:NAD(P)-dependent dehydrogenase (short-subunit alcohol dehydrogenase family)
VPDLLQKAQELGRLEGQIAVVTGGGTGIGKGIARAFAAEGADLAIASRNRARLDATADELRGLGADVLVVTADVGDERQVVALFEQVVERFGRLDILVNNSGIFERAAIVDMSYEAWRSVVAVNLSGAFLCTREAMRIMKPQGGGRIINIGSISAQMPRFDSAPYTATKHGLVGLTKSTALEGREFGIAACCLHPGNVESDMTTVVQGKEPMMTLDDIASVALTMAALPPHANMLEAIVLPIDQEYLGRG